MLSIETLTDRQALSTWDQSQNSMEQNLQCNFYTAKAKPQAYWKYATNQAKPEIVAKQFGSYFLGDIPPSTNSMNCAMIGAKDRTDPCSWFNIPAYLLNVWPFRRSGETRSTAHAKAINHARFFHLCLPPSTCPYHQGGLKQSNIKGAR